MNFNFLIFLFYLSTTKKFTDECLNIEGKCALVTDGTNGVGFAFANELLKNDAAVFILLLLNDGLCV